MKDVICNSDEYAESVKAIKEGLESFERGEGKPAKEALNRILQKDDIEEKELIALGLLRLPKEEKDNKFLSMPAPKVERSVIQKAMRE